MGLLLLSVAALLAVSYFTVNSTMGSSRSDLVLSSSTLISAEENNESQTVVTEGTPSTVLSREVKSSKKEVSEYVSERNSEIINDPTEEDSIPYSRVNDISISGHEELFGEMSDSLILIKNLKYHQFIRSPLRVYCSPCICVYDSPHVTANCSYRSKLMRIPQGFPRYITRIHISLWHNLKMFNVNEVLLYRSLDSVIINKNINLKKVGQFSSIKPIYSNITQLFLSDNSISEICKNSFTHFPKLTQLELNRNKLTHIKSKMFIGLFVLEHLNLASNNITSIENNSFIDMNNLRMLDLSMNKRLLGPNTHFTLHQYMANLSSLQILHVKGVFSDTDLGYPNDELTRMRSLTDLAIDGIGNETLGFENNSFTKLTRLVLGGKGGCCSIQFIQETFFQNMPNLEALVISWCPLRNIDSKAYKHVRHLTNLSISYTKYDLKTAFSELEGLQNSSLRHLQLVHVLNRKYVYRWLNDVNAKFLKNIPLVSLDLSYNNIVFLSECFTGLLPKTLKFLKLSRNTLTKMYYIVTSLSFLPHLSELDISNQDLSNLLIYEEFPCNISRITDIEDTSPFLCPKDKDEYHPRDGGGTVSLRKEDPQTNKKCENGENNLERERKGLKLSGEFPPNLKKLIASGFLDSRYHILIHRIPSNISLQEVDFSGSYYTKWGQGRMPENIKNADLSNNYCTIIVDHFFPVNNSLVNLFLSNNLLASQFTGDPTGKVFSNLKNLRLLDVSMNSLYQIPGDLFKGLAELETLILSENKIQILNISFSHMPRLVFIDVSKNSINWITRKSRDELDAIATDHNVTLDLAYNPLPCSCEGLEILLWMNNTNVQLWDRDFLTCIHENGETETDLRSLKTELETLQRQCAYKALTLFMCVSAILIICTLLVSLLMYRYRWKLRYLWSIALFKLFGAETQAAGNGYRFDAYILYTDDTRAFVLHDCVRELEEKRGHRLCIEERDFMPGTYIVSNIVSAVQNSSKTVPVVTPVFYEGDYSEYGVKMALMEEIFSKRPVLYLCLYQPTDNEDISHDLLTVMKNNSYVEFPVEDEASCEIQEIFWNKISSVIGKNEHNSTANLEIE